MKNRKSDPNFLRAYDRGMLRSAFVSLFWSIFSEQKKRDGLTLQALAKKIGSTKAELSRWFNGDPNWTLNTIASLANALEVDLEVRAVERSSKNVFTAAGLQTSTFDADHPRQINGLTSAKPSDDEPEPAPLKPTIREPEGTSIERASVN